MWLAAALAASAPWPKAGPGRHLFIFNASLC